MFELLTSLLLLKHLYYHYADMPLGNIILDPGSQSSDEGHSMMMPMMGHFNPYAYYPMQQPQHHQPPMMIHPIYLEDHSALNQHHEQQPEQHLEQQHEHYHQEEPQQHYEQQHEMGHQEHYEQPQEQEQMQHHQEPMQHYENEASEQQGSGGGGSSGGEEEQQQHEHHGDFEHQHPLIAMMMHGSGPQPAYQHMSSIQAIRQHPGLLAQLPVNQQTVAFQAQMAAAEQQALQEHQRQQQQQQAQQQQQQAGSQSQASNEVSQSSAGGNIETSTKPPNKAIALLEKTAANNPLVQIIKPLFKRNKEQKEAKEQQKKP